MVEVASLAINMGAFSNAFTRFLTTHSLQFLGYGLLAIVVYVRSSTGEVFCRIVLTGKAYRCFDIPIDASSPGKVSRSILL